MEEKSIEFLKSFLETPSPSGFEEPAQKLFVEYVRPYADRIETDVHSNVVATKNPEGKPRLMLASHCDEIGLMVNHITEEGFIYFSYILSPLEVFLLPDWKECEFLFTHQRAQFQELLQENRFLCGQKNRKRLLNFMTCGLTLEQRTKKTLNLLSV